MSEEKKPSSLRTRLERTRMTYERSKSNPMPIIFGAGFVLVIGIVLYVVAFSSPPKPVRQANVVPQELSQMPARPNLGPASGLAPTPKSDEEAVYYFVDEIKRSVPDKADSSAVQAALEKLQGALGKWPKYDAEIYFTMAIVVGKQEARLQGDPLRQMWADKLGYFQKALELIEAGGKFAYGEPQRRVNQLKESIRVAKEKSGQ